MEQAATDLLQLKGIGRVLVKRLQDAGLDSLTKIAQSGEEELTKISGINHLKISSIVDQAKLLAEVEPAAEPGAADALQQRLAEVQEQVRTLAEASLERFQQELEGKPGKKLVSDLARLERTLGLISFEGKKKSRRSGKALKRVQKRMAGLAADAGLKKVRKTLKRARKAVLKAVK
jgi:predicted RecB family nuclease